jgi:hypothetical protein
MSKFDEVMRAAAYARFAKRREQTAKFSRLVDALFFGNERHASWVARELAHEEIPKPKEEYTKGDKDRLEELSNGLLKGAKQTLEEVSAKTKYHAPDAENFKLTTDLYRELIAYYRLRKMVDNGERDEFRKIIETKTGKTLSDRCAQMACIYLQEFNPATAKPAPDTEDDPWKM